MYAVCLILQTFCSTRVQYDSRSLQIGSWNSQTVYKYNCSTNRPSYFQLHFLSVMFFFFWSALVVLNCTHPSNSQLHKVLGYIYHLPSPIYLYRTPHLDLKSLVKAIYRGQLKGPPNVLIAKKQFWWRRRLF